MRYAKPLLKRSHHVMVSEDGDICIGEIPGKAKILHQPPPWATGVLSLLDGQHTLPRIIKAASAQELDAQDSEIESFIEALAGFGLLEEGVESPLRSAWKRWSDTTARFFSFLSSMRNAYRTARSTRSA